MNNVIFVNYSAEVSPYRTVQCVVSQAYDEHSWCNPVYLNCGVQSFVIYLWYWLSSVTLLKERKYHIF